MKQSYSSDRYKKAKRALKYSLLLLLSINVLYWVHMLSGGGVEYCDGVTELATLKYMKTFGNEKDAWIIVRKVSRKKIFESCSTQEQFEALKNICDRDPETRLRIMKFAFDNIMKPDTPHFNRVHLIGVLETLSGESLEKSGYSLVVLTNGEIPPDEQENSKRGLEYIRNWWEERMSIEQ